MRVQIKDSVALVTGSNRGIGRAIVEELVAQGAAKVYATARSPDSLRELAELAPQRTVPITLDVTNVHGINAAANWAEDVNILINNAGVAEFAAIIAAEDISAARREMEVNYFGLLNMTRAFAPILGRNGGGALVNISSIAGLVSIPAIGTYSATKAAVHSLSQSVRAELAAQGTLVTCVYPGPIDTEMSRDVELEKASPQSVAESILAGVENGLEEVFPDPFSRNFVQELRSDPIALEKELAKWLPQAEKAA